MKKRLLSMLLVLVMVIGLLPTAAMAAVSPEVSAMTTTGYYQDAEWVAGVQTPQPELPEGIVAVNKTAEPVEGSPNVYNITLTVETETSQTTIDADAATTLVLDVSGSMKEDIQVGNGKDDLSLLDKVYGAEAGIYRMRIGIVGDLLAPEYDLRYHNGAWQYHSFFSGWVNLIGSDFEDNAKAIYVTRINALKIAAKNFVDSYSNQTADRWLSIIKFADTASEQLAWTNVSTEAGANAAKAAIDRLSANGGTNLDDGLRQASAKMDESTVGSIPAKNKYVIALSDGEPTFYINEKGNVAGDGGYMDKATEAATIKTATALKDSKKINKLYTICFDGGDTATEVLQKVASTTSDAYTAKNASDLSFIIDKLGETINSGTTGEGLVVTDPMAEYVTVTGTLPEGFVKGTGDTYTWTLAKAQQFGTHYLYTITYQIVIDADDPNFVEDQFYPTNRPTYLTYGEETVYFPVPGVKGVKTDYTVVYDLDGGVSTTTGAVDGKYTYTGLHNGDTTPVIAEPTKAGYNFVKWTPTVSDKVNGDDAVDGIITYTAVWELIPTYTLTYHVNGGNPDGPKQVSNLSAQNNYPLNTTTKPSHDPVDGVPVLFVGWTAKQDTKIYAKNETAPTCIAKVDIVGNTTVYAVYGYDTNGDNIPDVLQNWYTLTYDGNGATVGTVPAAPATYLTGSTVPVLGNTGNLDMTTGEGASLHNYVFAGWNTAADGTGTTYQAGGTFQINANTTLYAMWELDDWNDAEDETSGGDNIPDKYQAVVVYKSEHENKGTVSRTQEVVTIKDETYPIPAAVGRLKITGSTATPKTGYVFENWTSALTFTGANAATLAGQTIHNVEGGKTYTFTAHFDTAVPGLNITKTLKSVGGVEVASTTAAPMAKVGDEIVWIITVNNSGNCDLSKIPVKDVLKDEKGNELTGVSVRPIGTYGNYGDELGTSWTIETLPVGQTSEYIVTYKVTAADAGKTLTNSAVSGETTGNAPGVTVETSGLTVTKTVNKTTAKVGDKLTYTITVTNTGNTTLTGIVLTDAMLNVTETIDALRPEGSWTKSYEYTVKTADAGKTIVNTAVAKASDGTTGSDSSEGTKVQSTQIHVPTLNKKDHVAYIIGYEDNTVRPENNITRAEVATIFFRLLTDDSRARFWSQTNDFSDVSANDWFNNAVSTMANAGVLTGYPDGTFKPNAPITRAEFAAIAARFSDVVYNGKCSFTDVAATYWAADEIALAEHLGWITGYPDDTFRPSRNITRAEAMTLINRVLERAVEEEHMLKNMVKWIDNSPNAWYYEAVQEATNSHTYTRLSKKVPGQSFYYEDWVAILENPDWAALERAWSKANDQ